MNSLYAEVTKTILEQLQAGVTPWRKDWRAMPSAGIPYNVASSRPYSGANVVLLWLKAQQQGWPTLQFLTFKQARELGGNIKHGEKSTIVVFVKQLMVKDRKDEGETRLVPMLKAYRVFHVSQCEGLPEKVTNPVTKLPRNKHVRDALVDGFVASTRADVREGHGEPAYHPAGDYVSMPRFADFKTGDGFYSTLFHELMPLDRPQSPLRT